MRRVRSLRIIATILSGLFLSVFLPLRFPSVVLGQTNSNILLDGNTVGNNIALLAEINNYASEISKYLIENADQADFSIPLENSDFQRSFRRSLLSWRRVTDRIGGIFLEAQGQVTFPKNISLGSNAASAQASLAILHEGIEGVENLPPHFNIRFVGNASDEELLSSLSNKVGSTELTLNGLMLKGVPAYLTKNKVAVDTLRNNKVGLTLNSDDDTEVKLSKSFEITDTPQFQRLASWAALRRIDSRLNENKHDALRYRNRIAETQIQLEQARQQNRQNRVERLNRRLGDLESDLQEVQDKMQQNLTARYLQLATLPLKTSFTCAPEFMREFKFPIVERRVSISGQGSSASAGVGISGDVVIDIEAPTCTIALNPPFPFKLDSSIYSDVSLTSHGYLGGEANASGSQEFSIKFTSSKYGNYELTDIALNEKEKEAIAELALNEIDNLRNDERVVNDLANRIKDEFVDSTFSAIENALIGSVPDVSKICSLFDRLGRPTGFEVESVCWAFNIRQPPNPVRQIARLEVIAPRLPERPYPGVECQARSIPCVYTPSRTVTVPPYPCDFRLCTTVEVPESEQPPGCRAARTANETVCAALRRWNDEVKRLNREATTSARRVQAEAQARFDREYQSALATFNRWTRYRGTDEIRRVARNFVRSRILLSSDVVDTKAIARELLDLAWKIEEGGRQVNEWVDLTNKYLKTLTPGISVAANARLAFSSTANLLITKPQVTSNMELEFQNGELRFGADAKAYLNGPDAVEEGRIGGLDPLGIKFFAEQVVCLGGRVERSAGELSCSGGQEISHPRRGRENPWNLNREPLLGETIPVGQRILEVN